MSDLSPAEVVDWLREKAAELQRTADTIEQTFSVSPRRSESNGYSQHSSSPVPSLPTRVNRDITVEDIVGLMSDGRSVRRATIAKELDVPEHVVESFLDEEHGFKRNERGWYTHVGPPEDEEDTM